MSVKNLLLIETNKSIKLIRNPTIEGIVDDILENTFSFVRGNNYVIDEYFSDTPNNFINNDSSLILECIYNVHYVTWSIHESI